MHKRILCVLLAALMLLSLVPAFALPSRAASNMTTSEECIEILKKMEGFIKYPMYDHGQYSVGYGSGCDKDEYPNGITEEEADALLREYLVDMEEDLNDFADRQRILFSQNQFDALMLFTYNCGAGWMSGDGEFRQAVLDNAAGNSFIFYMTQWSSASGQLLPGLVNRRLIEADMYLNGSYENARPSNYTFVLYNNNEGDGKVKVQGYDCNLPALVQSVPTRDGYQFLGWYSAAEGGSWITELSAQNAEQTLYAHWQEAGAAHSAAASVSYQLSSDVLVTRDFYDVPNGAVNGSLNEDAVAVIQADYVDGDGVKWGKLPNGCWVKLGDPRIGTCDETEPQTGVQVTVTGDYVNVRTGPGTGYKVVAAVLEGDQIVVTDTVDVDGVLWGKFRAGWVCLQYTDYAGGLTPGEPEENLPEEDQDSDVVIAIGTVTASELNIRAAAGTHGYLMGCYKRGDKVEILEKTTVGGTPWGRTEKGWICLTYVELEEPGQEPETSEPAESETTEPETTIPETTVPETTVPPETGEEQPGGETVQGIPATVISKTGLNIRSGAGTNYPGAGAYRSGQKITILEQRVVGGVAWGRTDLGWVCMQYVRLDEVWTNESGVYGIVTSPNGLNIRSGAGVAYPRVGNYTAGEKIIVLEQTVAAGQKWGRTDKGWVCMDYVRLEESVSVPGGTEATEPETTVPETTAPETTQPEEEPDVLTGTVTASGLNVRDAAGVGGTIVGGYRRGDKVTILEQTLVNGIAWGRTDKGWINLSYVKLDIPVTEETMRTGVITASSLCIRKGPGTANAILGTYSRGDVVKILETVKVGTTTWGRTDKGWICMDYVQAVAVPDTGDDEEPEETTAPEKEATVETTEPEEEPTVETTEPEEEPTVETTEPEEEPTVETTEPEEEPTVETTAPEVIEPVAVFDFTCEDYVTSLNAELAAYDIVTKSVDSGMEDVKGYEFVAISDGGSYGVMMYVELAEDGKKVAGVTMACDASDDIANENLIALSMYAMVLIDDTITDADIEAMMSNSQVDEDGNQYYVMTRASGEFAFVLAGELLYFYAYPVA